MGGSDGDDQSVVRPTEGGFDALKGAAGEQEGRGEQNRRGQEKEALICFLTLPPGGYFEPLTSGSWRPRGH